MRIGLDLDNTIVCYDELFSDLAAAEFQLPANVPRDKTAIRDWFRREQREEEWTRLQGEAYGPAMRNAQPFSGIEHFMNSATRCEVEVCIISHRTRYPYAGPAYDLHAAAREWLTDRRIVGPMGVDDSMVFLEATREEKYARIAAQDCDVFVDDLPEFLTSPGFPSGVRPIWFSPHGVSSVTDSLESVSSWSELESRLGW